MLFPVVYYPGLNSNPSRTVDDRFLHACYSQWAIALNKPLSETDPDLFDIMEHEKVRKVEAKAITMHIIVQPKYNCDTDMMYDTHCMILCIISDDDAVCLGCIAVRCQYVVSMSEVIKEKGNRG